MTPVINPNRRLCFVMIATYLLVGSILGMRAVKAFAGPTNAQSKTSMLPGIYQHYKEAHRTSEEAIRIQLSLNGRPVTLASKGMLSYVRGDLLRIHRVLPTTGHKDVAFLLGGRGEPRTLQVEQPIDTMQALCDPGAALDKAGNMYMLAVVHAKEILGWVYLRRQEPVLQELAIEVNGEEKNIAWEEGLSLNLADVWRLTRARTNVEEGAPYPVQVHIRRQGAGVALEFLRGDYRFARVPVMPLKS